MTSPPHVIWLNGSFGGGKSTTAARLSELVPAAVPFDPEIIGEVLAAALPPVDDFQDLPAWRRLVVRTLAEIVEACPAGPVVVPMTVLRVDYLDELLDGLREAGVRVCHVLLDVDEQALRERILAADPGLDTPTRDARIAWRLAHVTGYRQTRPRLLDRADIVVDATTAPPEAVAHLVATRAGLMSTQRT